jgi:hypothetical protein
MRARDFCERGSAHTSAPLAQGPDITSHVTVQIKMTDRGQRRGWPERSPAMTEGEPFFKIGGYHHGPKPIRSRTEWGRRVIRIRPIIIRPVIIVRPVVRTIAVTIIMPVRPRRRSGHRNRLRTTGNGDYRLLNVGAGGRRRTDRRRAPALIADRTQPPRQ